MLGGCCGYDSEELKELTWASGERWAQKKVRWYSVTDDVLSVFIGVVRVQLWES